MQNWPVSLFTSNFPILFFDQGGGDCPQPILMGHTGWSHSGLTSGMSGAVGSP